MDTPKIVEETITESYHEEAGEFYFRNGDAWTGWKERDIFGNEYYEAARPDGKAYRTTEAPIARLL